MVPRISESVELLDISLENWSRKTHKMTQNQGERWSKAYRALYEAESELEIAQFEAQALVLQGQKQHLMLQTELFRLQAAEADGELRRKIWDLRARVPHCVHCGTPFNVIGEISKEIVVPRKERASKTQRMCTENIGNQECVKEQLLEKERKRRAKQAQKTKRQETNVPAVRNGHSR